MTEITDAMIDAYLAEQRRTVEEYDRFGRLPCGGLHHNTVREATRNGLRAALAAATLELPEPDGFIMDSISDGRLEYKRGRLSQNDAICCSTAPIYEARHVRALLVAHGITVKP